jgi:hypothetical protein
MRAWIVTGLIALAAASAGRAQEVPPRFHWLKGQVLTYKVEHQTDVSEVIGGSKVATSSHVKVTKRWQVLQVDDRGVATLQLSLAALYMEQVRPDGEKVVFDSSDVAKSDPGLGKWLTEKFLNRPLAVLRVDSLGSVVEVVKDEGNRFDSELPFLLALPAGAVRPGQAWERPFQVVLDPPQGTGEKYPAVQKYVWKQADATTAVFALSTRFTKLPESLPDQIPLLQKQPQGEVVFDLHAGRLRSARLEIDRELQNHQGTGSSYRFRSVHTEEYLP